MPRLTQNPLSYAHEAMNEAMNNHGQYSYVADAVDLEAMRLLFHSRGDVILRQRMSDLDNDLVSIFEHQPTETRFLLREWTCTDTNCDTAHGRLIISALSMDALSIALDLLANDDHELDNYMDFMAENRYVNYDDDDFHQGEHE